MSALPPSTHEVVKPSIPYTARQAAEYLRIPLQTVYYLAQQGKLPTVPQKESKTKKRNVWLFDQQALEKMV